MGPYIVIKLLSNNNYTIRKIGKRYTQSLPGTRIRPTVPEQRIPDVTVRSNEYLPDPDIKVSHNEWYAVSWEMDFGKQIDEHETSEIASNKQQAATLKKTNTNDEKSMQNVTENQTEDTNDVRPSSPDFSKLKTDVGDSPYIHRPQHTENPPIPWKSPTRVVGYNPRKTTRYKLRTNPKPMLILTSDDLTL